MTEQFGTPPHKLHHKDGPETSKIAAHAVDTTTWEEMVYQVVCGFGSKGCIQDEVLDKMKELAGQVPYSTVTARFKALSDKDLIRYKGTTRKGKSGRPSRVRVATKFYEG